LFCNEFCLTEEKKTENAFSPARTKASNADMTACLPLQDCIVQTTSIPAYGRIISRRYMGAARLQWQVLKLHVCACRCPAAAAGSQTAVTVMQSQDTKLHAQMRTATLLQWQDTKLHAQMRTAALLQWQDTKLHACVAALLQCLTFSNCFIE
jgi:hypothetical protein